MKRLTIAALAAGHSLIHVASFGLDDLFIILILGAYLLWRSN